MFFGRSNNNGNGVNINTSFYSSYTETSLLTAGGWNRSLSIKIQPATGKDANGVVQYAQEQSSQVITSIREENALALLKGYDDEIKPAIDNGTEAKVTITMGSDENRKALSIIYDGKDAYLEIASVLNSDGITSENNVIKHKFNKKSYMSGYNYLDGSGKEVPTEADLYNFIEKVRDVQKLVPVIPHSINYSNAVKSAYKNSGSSNNYSQNNSYSAPTNNFSGDMGDFLPMS